MYTTNFPVYMRQWPDSFYMKEALATFYFFDFEHEDQKLLHMEFMFYSDPNAVESMMIEKDDTLVEEYVSNGQVIYIFSNLENNVATWSCDSWVVEIVGAVSTDELKRMVDSI